MTPPDRPATAPAPDLDAPKYTYTYGYGIVRGDGTFKGCIDKDGYEGTSVYGPGERRVRVAIVPEDDARSITSLRERVAELEKMLRRETDLHLASVARATAAEARVAELEAALSASLANPR